MASLRGAAHLRLVRLPRPLPPGPGPARHSAAARAQRRRRAAAWPSGGAPAESAALRICRYRELDAGIAGLQQHEEGIQELAQDLYRAVEERCVELQGYPVEELKPMLEAQCLAAAAERRQAAVKLLHDSDKYLLVQVNGRRSRPASVCRCADRRVALPRQAQGWHRSVRAVSLFLRHLAMLYENHKVPPSPPASPGHRDLLSGHP